MVYYYTVITGQELDGYLSDEFPLQRKQQYFFIIVSQKHWDKYHDCADEEYEHLPQGFRYWHGGLYLFDGSAKLGAQVLREFGFIKKNDLFWGKYPGNPRYQTPYLEW